MQFDRTHTSPNFEDRKDGKRPYILLLHYTGMQNAEAALHRLCDKAANVSSHYVIDESGKIYQLVDESKRAFHAGVSFWRGERDINSCSIGIEIVNPGHEFGYRAFPKMQMQSVIALSKDIIQRHAIKPRHVLGHSDVAPARKMDPGELFDWTLLAQNGIGLMPRGTTELQKPLSDAQKMLAEFGYEIAPNGQMNEATKAVIAAFQSHYLQHHRTGYADAATIGALADLLAQIA